MTRSIAMHTKLSVLLVALLLCTTADAQPGSLDTTFNTTDVGYGSGIGANSVDGTVHAMLWQPDGRAILAGNFNLYNDHIQYHIVRVLPDGWVDDTFFTSYIAGDQIKALALQPDGRVLIGGDFTAVSGTPRAGIARLNSDGSLDTSFDPGAGADGQVDAVALQPDGRILIGGWFTNYDGVPRARVARLLANGSLDPTFDPALGANGQVFCMALQPDGRVLLGGAFTQFNGATHNRIARLNDDGSLDPAFTSGTGASSNVYTMALQPDGRVVIGGTFTSYNGTPRNYVLRLLANGTLDTSLLTGTGTNGSVHSLVLQPDGRVLMGGAYLTYNGAAAPKVARLNTNGTLDASFDPGAGPVKYTAPGSVVHSLALRADGKVLVGGDFQQYDTVRRNHVLLVHADGSPDLGFNPETSCNGIVRDMVVQPDGRAVIVGDLTAYNEVRVGRIVRVDLDGSLDPDFDAGMGPHSQELNKVLLQPDGKLVCVGMMSDWNGTACGRIVRLNSDGSVDPGFTPGSGANGGIMSAALQPDGRILIGGQFTSYAGNPAPLVARLNSDGTFDPTFQVGAGANSAVLAIAVQADGRILVGGQFDAFNAAPREHLVRLETNGAVDASFTAEPGNLVTDIVIQPDGNILVGGAFTDVSGAPAGRIARLLPGGALDPAFLPGTGASSWVRSIALTASGHILVAGHFSSFNGSARGYVARLLADGSLDLTYNPGIGSEQAVNVVRETPDGRALVGGYFLAYDGVGRNRLARLQGDLNVAFGDAPVAASFAVYPNPSQGSFTFCVPEGPSVRWSVVDALGHTVVREQRAMAGTTCTIDLSDHAAGAYVLHVVSADGQQSRRLMVE